MNRVDPHNSDEREKNGQGDQHDGCHFEKHAHEEQKEIDKKQEKKRG